MKKSDIDKPPFAKVGKTINFDKIVLEKLEERARKAGTSVSNLVNWLCKKKVMTDEAFYTERSKYHLLKFHENQFLKDQAKAINENRKS